MREDLGDYLQPKRMKVKHKRKTDDELFRFTGMISLERRKSERLSNTKPKYSYRDLDKVEGFESFDNDKDPVSYCM